MCVWGEREREREIMAWIGYNGLVIVQIASGAEIANGVETENGAPASQQITDL